MACVFKVSFFACHALVSCFKVPLPVVGTVHRVAAALTAHIGINLEPIILLAPEPKITACRTFVTRTLSKLGTAAGVTKSILVEGCGEDRRIGRAGRRASRFRSRGGCRLVCGFVCGWKTGFTWSPNSYGYRCKR
jgi:hypothetical protein